MSATQYYVGQRVILNQKPFIVVGLRTSSEAAIKLVAENPGSKWTAIDNGWFLVVKPAETFAPAPSTGGAK
ncbi:MAG: hypothetical protein ABFD92_16610 [Planctomycetaceae bacterium]|nr:hypothetical protein [Planctomycetaceae bacterium]